MDKSHRPLDRDRAVAFMASVPRGRWTTYGDVAAAAQSPRGAQAVGMWLARDGHTLPNVYRVINARGEVSDGWRAAGADLPETARQVQRLLEAEGVRFDARGRADQSQRWRASDWQNASSAHPASSAT
jgi:alkylated DNA nucleotide flippase Atl1